jgi:hypothetical protein
MDMDFDGPEEEGEEDGMGAGGWSPTAGSSGNWEDGGRAVMFPASNDVCKTLKKFGIKIFI